MEIDVLIVSGRLAGLAVATRLYGKRVHNILIIEREKQLGGIPRQYIHDGFGLTCFKAILSKPEYTQRFIDEVEESGILYITGVAVLEVTEDRTVTAATRQGPKVWKTRSVVLIMGCRERTRGASEIPSERPVGVFMAGVAQAYISLCNVVPAKEVVILGSRNIGMIMARRPTLKGIHVQAVFEIQSYPSGLPRNVEQCLNDYGTPLYLSHTITTVHGDNHLTGVAVSRVDEHSRPVPGAEREYKCDTLILSMGLIPESELSLDAGATLDDRTKGTVVDEHLQADVEEVFVVGNMFHVRDLVDFVSMEAESLANSAVGYVQNGCLTPCPIEIETDSHINYTVPQRASGARDFKLSLRVDNPLKECSIGVGQDGVLVALRKTKRTIPTEIIELAVRANKLVSLSRSEMSAEC